MASAQVATIRSEREGGQAVLNALEENVDAGVSMTVALPAGFGDCYIIRAGVRVLSIATIMVNPEFFGPLFRLVGTGGSATADLLDTGRWTRSFTLQLAYTWQPFIAPLWRDGELFQIISDEVDVDVAPTADVDIYLLVQRRQNMPGMGPAPVEVPVILTS